MPWKLVDKVRAPFTDEYKSWISALHVLAYGLPVVEDDKIRLLGEDGVTRKFEDTGIRYAYGRADKPVGYVAGTLEEVGKLSPRKRKDGFGKLQDFWDKWSLRLPDNKMWGVYREITGE
ncbi:MAG: hypothetical protein HY051_04975 [Candidatus Aenigmarchaeota archaeon]|nr:hypothetical protein [Candidatus Aenigmarchaeota archaeon]